MARVVAEARNEVHPGYVMKTRKAPPGLVRLNELRKAAKVAGVNTQGTLADLKARLAKSEPATPERCVIEMHLTITLKEVK